MMRYVVLATDYDGTLASQGKVEPKVLAALERFRREGRVLILVTGRELDELLAIFPEITLFHRVVAENGGLLYCPQSGKQRVLGEPPSSEFVHTLIDRGVQPLSIGRSIVATFEPNESTVLATIRDLGLELQVIFNKGAVMVLPAGVNKATGLAEALEDLSLSMRNVVAIGDAENDHAMLRASEFGVAVANALPSLMEEADHTSMQRHGDAVAETMEWVLRDDLSRVSRRSERRPLRLGTRLDGTPLTLPEAQSTLLLTGPDTQRVLNYLSLLVEQLLGYGYQVCIVDFEGSLARTHGTITLGTKERLPTVEEVRVALFDSPTESVVVNLKGQEPVARDVFVVSLVQECEKLRRTHGRPHWCIFANAPQENLADLYSRSQEGRAPSAMLYAGVDLDSAQFLGPAVAIAPGSLRSLKANGGVNDDPRDLEGVEAAFWSNVQDNHPIAFTPQLPTSSTLVADLLPRS